ncbi:TPA: hypothetical protein HA318_04655 [Candidatus Micrarchaeota archaeon]|nr:MAG: hypothetical protein AUJ65_05925 [Candidatus Micrarchaeota archaeon CG1_02_51_15]HII39263.1 hypothetical protein [Candidatus Micrarchaeota archaeon]
MKNALLFMTILLAACLASAYSDYSFSVTAQVKEDGSMHVMEKTVFLFDNDLERNAFDSFMNSGENSVIEWRKFSKNIRYHFGGVLVESQGVKISARREYSVGFSAGSVVIEYDLSHQMFIAEKKSSRVTQYSLNSSYLSFDVSRDREPVLGNGMKLEITLPPDATIVEIAPVPDTRQGNTLSWTGPVIGEWKVIYSREQPIGDEVNEFFIALAQNAFAWIPLILAIIVIGFLALKLFKQKA